MLRLFVALELPDSWRLALTAWQSQLRAVSPEGSWVKPENFHLTLQFLGSTPEEQLAAVSEAVKLAAGSCAPFALNLRGAGAFPQARRARVLWVGLQAEPELQRLAEKLGEQLAAIGYPPEKRLFAPHLTLGRRKQPRPDAPLQRALAELQGIVAAEPYRATEVSLMSSQLKPTGAVYERVSAFPLGGQTSTRQ
jgi:RNA 2',3'-cyclic 3'-phosphodiesterase